jgi:hypothetical protein
MMYHYASQKLTTRKNIEPKIGPGKNPMAEYDKIKRITFPVNHKHLLMITTQIEGEHTSVIKKILELINN